MPRPRKQDQIIEESIRLSSDVTVVVKATAAVYDTLNITRVGGVATVALPGASVPSMPYAPQAPGQYVAPQRADLSASRAALEQQFPQGAVPVVSPASLGMPPLTPEMLGEGGGGFIGRSNEDAVGD